MMCHSGHRLAGHWLASADSCVDGAFHRHTLVGIPSSINLSSLPPCKHCKLCLDIHLNEVLPVAVSHDEPSRSMITPSNQVSQTPPDLRTWGAQAVETSLRLPLFMSGT
jgi:hypothetical protein